jgi:hypothetical protein
MSDETLVTDIIYNKADLKYCKKKCCKLILQKHFDLQEDYEIDIPVLGSKNIKNKYKDKLSIFFYTVFSKCGDHLYFICEKKDIDISKFTIKTTENHFNTDIVSTTNIRTTQQTSKKQTSKEQTSKKQTSKEQTSKKQTSKNKRTSKTKTKVITKIRKNEEINLPINIEHKKKWNEDRIKIMKLIFISISVLILLFATFGTLIIFYLNRKKFIVIRHSDVVH